MEALPRRWLLFGVALVLVSVLLGFVSISCDFDESGIPVALGMYNTDPSNACQGQLYEHVFSASGGESPYTWTIRDSNGDPDPSKLPPGLKLDYKPGADSDLAKLAGTPTTPGTFSFQVEVKDAKPPPKQENAVRDITVQVSDFVITTSKDLPAFCPGEPYDVEIMTCGGTSPLQWALKGTLPSGLNLIKGHLQGTPTDTGQFNFTVSVQDSSSPPREDDQDFTLESVDSLTILSPALLPRGATGKPYGPVQFKACGGQPPYGWKDSGNKLPPWGLSLSLSGKLDGTPQVLGIHQFRLVVEDSSTPSKKSTALTLLIPVDAGPVALTSPSPLPDATECAQYNHTFTASGGSGSYQWSAGQPLPEGLKFDAGGVHLYGFPALPAPNPATVEITVADAADAANTATKTFSLNVLEYPVSTPDLQITELRHVSADPAFYNKFNLSELSQNVRIDFRFTTPKTQPYLSVPQGNLKANLALVGQCGGKKVSHLAFSPSPTTIGGQSVRVARFNASDMYNDLFVPAGKKAGDAVMLRFSVDVTVDTKIETFVNILPANLYNEQ